LIHFLLLSIYYFFPICCTIPNDLKIFKHVANLPWRINPKSNHHFGHFFIQMWPSEVQMSGFLLGLKKNFCHFKRLYLTIYMVENSEFFSTYLKFRKLQDPTVTCVQKCFFWIKKLLLILKMAVLEHFGENIAKNL